MIGTAQRTDGWTNGATGQNSSGGQYIGATNFDGGPLANVAYDPRVGRTSEVRLCLRFCSLFDGKWRYALVHLACCFPFPFLSVCRTCVIVPIDVLTLYGVAVAL